MRWSLLCLLSLPLFATPDFEAAYEVQEKELRNIDVCHPQLLIAFSGTPGMGKTHLAELLEQRLQAVTSSERSSHSRCHAHSARSASTSNRMPRNANRQSSKGRANR